MTGSGAGAGKPPPPPAAAPPPPIVGAYDAAPRFESTTSRWYHFGSGESHRLFQTDTPSGYGWWPFARAAAKSGGTYLFYPFRDSRFLDACPYDPARLGDLAPGLSSAAEWEAACGADPALEATLRAEAEVRDLTPWIDGLGSAHEAEGWGGFVEASPLRRTNHYRVRRRPIDTSVGGDSNTIAAAGAHVADALPAYERALERMDEAFVAMRSGAMPGRGGRADANLRYARFGFAMSAFHLHALSISMQEVEKFIPATVDPEHVYTCTVRYMPTIRMSDVLEGYDGLSMTAEKEAAWSPPKKSASDLVLLGQGNLLLTPRTEPLYRSKRDLSAVVRYLDPRLFRDAHRMIAAAHDVMADFARTPWGWSVYYSDAFTFTFSPILDMTGHTGPVSQGKKPPKPPTTPKTPGAPTTPTPAPTTPGGPTTGGG